MSKTALVNMSGAQVGEIELSDAVFGIEPNQHAMHMAVVNYLANQRQGTQSTLTRSEVSGGGKKPYRQKGTGRARQGSTRAPHYTHGGIAFGPKPRSYRFTINKKLRKLAMRSVFSQKVLDSDLIVVDEIAFDEIKTKEAVRFLKAIDVDTKAIIVTDEANEKVYKSARNIEGVEVQAVNTINVYNMMKATKLILSKAALDKIEEVYA